MLPLLLGKRVAVGSVLALLLELLPVLLLELLLELLLLLLAAAEGA